MWDAAAAVCFELRDLIVLGVRGQENLANPVGTNSNERAGRTLGGTFTAPAADVGAIDLMALELDLDLGLEPPSSWPSAAGAAGKRAKETTGESGLGRSVLSTRRRLLYEISRDDFVEARRLRQRQQVGSRGKTSRTGGAVHS